jgi:hypothetical protein
VGNNGETLVADSSATTGLRYNPQNALANPIINGGMDIWQRGTSNITTASAYTADRWQKNGATHYGVSRQTVSDSTNLPNIQYSARVQRTNGSSTTSNMEFTQSIETVNSIPFAGKTVTWTFYARRGANYSPTSNLLQVLTITGTGTDQNVLSGFTGTTYPLITSVGLTTTWTRYAFTFNIPTTATQMGFDVYAQPTGTAGADDWFEVTGMQIDLGTYTASTAPSFRRSQGTIQGELAACQRYYQRVTGRYGYVGTGTANSSTDVLFQMALPVQMRIAPTALSVSALGDWKLIPGNKSISAFNLAAPKTSIGSFYVTSTGLSANQSWTLYPEGNTNGDNSFIDFTAEL